ncbi:hypothetical protein QJS04_geneDACA006401 [Acorus gramineus]|uniref:Small EDRK-rich factor-like N-terminal domain-containing protein n=1 Tax=Acorus gramineus TaxID=55184 RepID=A0AAV9AYL6_ACOGR|nr:hypothetical protein QJS04_geneDACA006401 [Acorus gramineus]
MEKENERDGHMKQNGGSWAINPCGRTEFLSIILIYAMMDLENIKKKREEEKALKELRAKAQKGALGGAGLKKSGKK